MFGNQTKYLGLINKGFIKEIYTINILVKNSLSQMRQLGFRLVKPVKETA